MKSAVTSIGVLIASLCIALGPILYQLDSFDQLLTPKNMGETLPILGAILLAWIGRSPLLNR